jgi:succinate dehydrogenase / fumarate reductase cytochrome b subunit
MVWSGPIIAAFIVYHLLHFTTGTVHPDYEHLKPYENVIIGFQQPVVSAFYILSIVLLAVHLYHGLWSLFQSLGLDHPSYSAWRRVFAVVFAVVIAGGFISVPLAVLTGVLHL